jgi:hypothetical protein
MKNEREHDDCHERCRKRSRRVAGWGPLQHTQCSDRMCGADDCPNCRPENFLGGVYFRDIQETETNTSAGPGTSTGTTGA